MFIPKKPKTSNLFGVAVIGIPLAVTALAAKSVNDYYYPADNLVCKSGTREAHIFGNTIGWVSQSTLALFHTENGKRVYDGIQALQLRTIGDTAEAKREEALKAARTFCKSGSVQTLINAPL